MGKTKNNEKIKFGVYLNHPDAKIPKKSNPTDAGWDITSIEEATFEPGERKIIDTGVVLDMTKAIGLWEAQVRPRSGNAAKFGLTIVNTPGTIDQHYVGNVKVIMLNTSKDTVQVPKGSKIAQLVFQRVPEIELEQLQELPTNDSRGTNGFGSTGLKG